MSFQMRIEDAFLEFFFNSREEATSRLWLQAGFRTDLKSTCCRHRGSLDILQIGLLSRKSPNVQPCRHQISVVSSPVVMPGGCCGLGSNGLL
jgi:hypothetical protein